MLNIDNLTYSYTSAANRLITIKGGNANVNPMGGAGYNYDLNDDRMVPIENWKWSATKALDNEGNATNRIASTTNNSYKQITDTKYYFNHMLKDIIADPSGSNPQRWLDAKNNKNETGYVNSIYNGISQLSMGGPQTLN